VNLFLYLSIKTLMLSHLELALNEALQDEYKACETYRLVMEKLGPIRPFVNIMAAEQRHIRALWPLFRKYQFPIPINPWPGQLTVPDNFREACLAGVEAEIENGVMYAKLLKLAVGYPDVQRVFRNLQRASQENHLRAFQRGAGLPINPLPPKNHELSNIGIGRGCRRHGQRSAQPRRGCGCSAMVHYR
jgi:hypothetical protein